MARKLSLDFESHSAADIRKVGLHLYATDPTTDVWCCQWCVDDGEIQNWRPDQPVPALLRQALADPAVEVVGHNVGFEYAIIEHICGPRYGWPVPSPDRLNDTAARAAMCSLPRALGDAAEACGLDVTKDAAGRRLMLQMAKPRRTEPDGTIIWWDDENRRQRLEAYCRQDVVVERELDELLPELPKREKALWLLDFKVNRRGVQVDLDLIEQAELVLGVAMRRYNKELSALTGGAVSAASKVADMRDWLSGAGVDTESLDKVSVASLLSNAGITGPARRVLEIRQEAGKSSTAKLKSFTLRTDSHGRMRDNLLYHGAGTGRWSGMGVQLQNMPRPTLKARGIALAIDVLKDESLSITARTDLLELLFGSVPEVISSCLRSCIAAAPGRKLIVSDYANIEGRVAAWLAGQTDKVEIFRSDGPVYERMAAAIFKVPVESIGKESEERFLGKTAELGCFEAGTGVLCRDRRWETIHTVAIECVDPEIHQVWDGVEWVSHSGPIYQGRKGTLRLSGVGVTPDHRVWCGRTWHPAKALARNESMRSRALATALESCQSWVSKSENAAVLSRSESAVRAEVESTGLTGAICDRAENGGASPVAKRAGSRFEKATGATRILSLTRPTGAGCLTGSHPASSAVTTREPVNILTTAGAASTFTRAGVKIAERFSDIWSGWKGGIARLWSLTESTLTGGTNLAISVSSPANRTRATSDGSAFYKTASQSWKPKTPVYDIASAGPRSRFTVLTDDGPMIVHNCTYQMGAPKFQASCADKGVAVSDEMAQATIATYREVNYMLPRLWRGLEDAAVSAMEAPGETHTYRGVAYKLQSDRRFLLCRLPSGRIIYYPSPLLQDKRTPWGAVRQQVTYMSINQVTRKWERTSTYGGKLAENCTQALARDLLASAMRRLDKAGYRVVLTVHDEIVGEPPAVDEYSLADFDRLMCVLPKWAQADSGCPVASKGYEATRYRK